MLADVIKTFEKEYKKYGDSYITDDYIPADGEYILLGEQDNELTIIEKIIIKQDKKTKEVDIPKKYETFIRNADYMSKYLDSNKAVKDKNIHSNSWLTFFVKKENVHNGKINDEVISSYFKVFKNPYSKYKDRNAKKLYEEIENKNGKTDKELIGKVESWVKDNIYSLVDTDSKDKTYLKVFFYTELDTYQKESEKYILTNIYNTTDYNTTIADKIYGLPNDNMGLNSKKPYLENKTRKTKVPYLLSQEQVLIQKKFFDYLFNQVSKGKTNIYIDDNKIKSIANDDCLKEDFKGYYLRIKKGKEIEIHDFDIIGNYQVNIPPMKLSNVLALDKSKIEYSTVNTIEMMRNIINEIFFSKFLGNSYFTDAKDIKINDSILKKNLLLSRNVLFAWFYKGNRNNVWKVLKQSSLDLIKGSIYNGYILKASEQFNLRCSLKNYFEGGENMADVLLEIKESLRKKINEESTGTLENDREYYFAVGQLTSYFISLNKSKSKTHSLANPIINGKTDRRIKDELKKMYKKYNYNIDVKRKRFKNLYSMISSYMPEGKVEDDLIIAGYLHSNLIYEKVNKGEEDYE